jgi:integrase
LGNPIRAARPTAADAGTSFLAWAEGRVKLGRMSAGCLRNYRIAVAAFTAAFGPRLLAALTPEEIETWAARPDWSATYQRNVLGVVLGVFKRTKCPITISRPPAESRGPKSVVPDADLAKLVAEAERRRPGGQGDVGPLLRVLRETGARPGEVAGLTVEDVDWDNCCVLLARHKTARHTGRGRPLVFNAEAMRVLLAQRARWKSGHLFRTKMRKAWTVNGLAKRLLALSAAAGVKVCAYWLRHTFATDKLRKGMPDALLAAALGHRGTGMLHKHYSHLCEDARAIREAMDRADRAAG